MAAGVLTFLRAHRLAVQASVSSTGGPQAAVVGYAVTDRLEIVFDTLESTRKAQNLRGNSRIAVSVGGLADGEERTVQLEGVADEPAGEALEALKRAYYDVFPDGPTRLAWPGLIYVRVRPTWIRDSDYGVDPPELIEFREAGRADVEAMAEAHRDSIRSLGPRRGRVAGRNSRRAISGRHGSRRSVFCREARHRGAGLCQRLRD